MGRIDLPVESEFRVEEIKLLVDIEVLHGTTSKPVVVVALSLYLIRDVSILQVGIGIQSSGDGEIGLQIDIAIVFGGIVEVIVSVHVQITYIVLQPQDASEVIAIITIETSAKRSIHDAAFISERKHATSETVVHRFLTHEVTLLHQLILYVERFQAIFRQGAIALVLLVEAITLGVVQSRIEVPLPVEVVVEEQLEILLHVVVRLVFVVVILTLSVCKHIATRVVGAAICCPLVFRGIVPGVIGFLLTSEGYQLYAGAIAIPSALQVVRV